jgi:hypothetical protein
MGADAMTATSTDAGACRPSGSLAGARIMLITDKQYANAVRDVFGADFTGKVTSADLPDGLLYSAGLSEHASFDANMAQAARVASAQIAANVKPCGDALLSAACVETFLRAKVPRAWRRPVTDEEISSILALFNLGMSVSPQRAMEVTMGAILESGSFLYRTEIGQDAASSTAASIRLTPYELASAVSFAFYESVPDDSLWAKAEDASILKPEVLSAEADRLLAVPAVRDTLKKKISNFLGFELLPSNFSGKERSSAIPELTLSLENAIYQSGQLFIDDIFSKGHFRDLFTSPRVYANGEMANVYGFPGVSGSMLVAIDTMGSERSAGLLTQPAYLAVTNRFDEGDDIVGRGLAIFNTFVCHEPLGDMPPQEVSVFEATFGTARERWLKVGANPQCGPCHNLFDPLGLASLDYDAIGRHRTTETDPIFGVTMIDTSAVLQGLGADLDGSVTGIQDVAKRFAAGRHASDCAALHLTNYTVDHVMKLQDACALRQIQDQLAQTGSFPELFKAIVTSPAFLTRDLQVQP